MNWYTLVVYIYYFDLSVVNWTHISHRIKYDAQVSEEGYKKTGTIS